MKEKHIFSNFFVVVVNKTAREHGNEPYTQKQKIQNHSNVWIDGRLMGKTGGTTTKQTRTRLDRGVRRFFCITNWV